MVVVKEFQIFFELFKYFFDFTVAKGACELEFTRALSIIKSVYISTVNVGIYSY